MKDTMIKKRKVARQLSNYEQETIINFNKEEDMASIFTYEKTWQQHLERKLGLRPVMDNGYGGKDYQLPKERIPMPRVKKVLSAEHKEKLAATLGKARQAKQEALFKLP